VTALKGAEGFLFGADPELFVVDTEGNYVSAHGLIEGTKQEPFKVDKGAYQVDGMAAEFNIEPVDNFEAFNTNIITVLRQLKAALPKGFGLKIEPAVRFSQPVMDAQPAVAKEMGCDPDFNAWTGDVNPTPDTTEEPLLRTASGHLHIGWTEDMPVTDEIHNLHCRDLIKQLDWFLGAWSVRKDPDVTRRKLYGKAGAYRPKPYGAEYRVLSNFWLKDKATRLIVWNRMQEAIAQMRVREYAKQYDKHNDLIVHTINTGKEVEGMAARYYYPLVSIQ
jgi:hypothetical protein